MGATKLSIGNTYLSEYEKDGKSHKNIQFSMSIMWSESLYMKANGSLWLDRKPDGTVSEILSFGPTRKYFDQAGQKQSIKNVLLSLEMTKLVIRGIKEHFESGDGKRGPKTQMHQIAIDL